MTECTTRAMEFPGIGRRRMLADFDGGRITSDGGALLLRELEDRLGVLARAAACFTDHRDPELIEHSILELLTQRVFGLCLGYEDLNDHDVLRLDPLFAAACGKDDPEGRDRLNPRDVGKALAGKSTLNRLELTPPAADADSRYKKITASLEGLQDVLLEAFLAQQPQSPAEVILDFDATDDPVHGHQLGRFFHGYYDQYCFLPLYVFCGDHPLCAQLRPADIDASAGALHVLQRLVGRLRTVWPQVRIILRADSGFCREPLLAWCEAHRVDYVVGLAKNSRLEALITDDLAAAQAQFGQTGEPARLFRSFAYQTRESWSRPRRVVAKAEHLAKGSNPRFVVTSLGEQTHPSQSLYEQVYCARGEMENRIKEQQLFLFADRTSCQTLRANQLRLLFSTLAYVLLRALREHGLSGTALQQARCDTLRLKLLKIGGLVTVSVRRVVVRLSSACPLQSLFRHAAAALAQLPAFCWPTRPVRSDEARVPVVFASG